MKKSLKERFAEINDTRYDFRGTLMQAECLDGKKLYIHTPDDGISINSIAIADQINQLDSTLQRLIDTIQAISGDIDITKG